MEPQVQRSSPRFLVLIIGIIIGLLIAGGFVLIRSALKNDDGSPTTETKGLLLSISKPSVNEVVSDKKIKVEGSTGKDSVVVVTGGVEDSIVETSSGRFTTDTELLEGENELTVYAFDTGSGESVQASLNIAYLPQDAASVSVAALYLTEVNEKTKEKLESLKEKVSTNSSELKKQASGSSSHVFGTITSISGETLTIETNKGDVKTVFTDDLTKFFSVGSGGRQTITLEDLKAGDRVSAVGVSQDEVSGSAKYIIKLNRAMTKRHAVMGKVKSIDGDTIVVTHLVHTDRTFTIKTNNDTVIKIKGKDTSNLSDVEVNDVIVASGTVDGSGVITAGKIFVVPGQFEGIKESTESATPSSR